MTVSSTSDHKEKHTREKKTAQLVNARSRLQFGVGEFQELWELVASGRHLYSNRLYRSFCRTGLNHANMETKLNTMFFWLFSMAGSTVSLNNAITQVHCKVQLILEKERDTCQTNSIGVRESDKLKVVRFPRSFAIISTPSPKIVNFGWRQHGVWIRSASISDVRCP